MASEGSARRLTLILAILAILCLSHTVQHDVFAGPDHHESGDAAGGTIMLVFLVLGAALVAAVGGLFRRRQPWVLIVQVRATFRCYPEVLPRARAGPVALGVLRN